MIRIQWPIRLIFKRPHTVSIAASILMVGIIAAASLPEPPALPAARSAPSAPPASRSVFERRILPIFKSNNPSTCSECHLSGVDLKEYIRPSEAQTFASLRDAGLIDLKHPDESHILRFILMSRPKSLLVNQKVRTAEYQAFRDWIVAAAGNPKFASLPALPASKRAGPAVPNAVIRHERIDAVVASFVRNVWSQEGRCMGCHRAGSSDNDAKVKQYGLRVAWFKPDSPEATMRTLIAQGDVDVEQPEQSLILLKPLGKVPHGGGVKMIYGDIGYKMFRAWAEDYAADVKGKYRTVGDLPTPPTESLVNAQSVFTVWDAPRAWWNKSLRVDAYPWDAARNAWSQRPVASGERLVYESSSDRPGATNLFMFFIVSAGGEKEASSQTAPLPAGKYLLKYYCDTEGKTARDYTLPTDSPAFFQGQQEAAVNWNAWNDPMQIRASR